MDAKSIWAKKSEGKFHPLLYHMIDVYHTALLLINNNINNFTCLDSFTKHEANLWAALIGLHDIGKANPYFQNSSKSQRHEKSSVQILMIYLKDKYGLDSFDIWNHDFFQVFKYIILHHSKFNPIYFEDSTHSARSILGDAKWKNVQFEILDNFFTLTNINPIDFKSISLSNTSDAAYLSGLITLSDWLGSDSNIFTFEYLEYSPEKYFEISKKRAKKAVSESGINSVPNITNSQWNQLFPQIKTPRDLQKISINCQLYDDSNLIIIEAPTGEGKTEAAFNLAARLACNKNSGVYVAMPTQATSNGLMNRFTDFISNADKSQNINLKLIHGNTLINNLKSAITPTEISSDDDNFEAFEWFNNSKRAFLAPYGIGTVDQALFSVLYVKHFFLRLYSLSGKTIIFDEVHAYDLYMSQLLVHLINWLKALKANVILLSATLPLETKNKLIQAWNNNANYIDNSEYPVVNVINDNSIVNYYFKPRYENNENNKFIIDFCDFDEIHIAQLADFHCTNGAKVLVIVNKVKRSQKIFDLLSTTNKYLFHSKFTVKDRENIEHIVLSLYGKNSNSIPSVLVSTQIVEQSLDIDFDIIISDLAPIDLLIQRAGRLHRHTKNRLADYEIPKFIISTHHASESELPILKDDNIYSAIFLYRTYYAIVQNKDNWNFHKDFRAPVESVYYKVDEDNELLLSLNLNNDAKSKIIEAIKKFRTDQLIAENESLKVMIFPANEFNKILDYGNINLIEENDGKGIVAKTRLGADTDNLILLFENNDKYYLDSDFTDEIDTDNYQLDNQQLYKLLINKISLYSHQSAKICQSFSWWEKIQKHNKLLRGSKLLIINHKSDFYYDNKYGLKNKE